MSQFVFGDTVIHATGTEAEKIKEQLTPVTLETLAPIELEPSQESMVSKLKDQIDVSNAQAILDYGVGQQSALSNFSKTTLENIKTSDMGEIGTMVSELTVNLETDDNDEDASNVVTRLFKRSKNKIKALQVKYESAQKNIDRIVGVLENHSLVLNKDNKDVEQMKVANKEFYQTLMVYVMAGREKIKELNETEMQVLTEKAQSGDQNDINELTQLSNQIHNFERKIADLDATMMISQMMAIQFETITNGNIALLQKLQTTKTVTIPVWEMNMTAMFYGENTLKAADAQRQISETTEALMKKTAANLRAANYTAQTESERQVVSMDTIREVSKDVLGSLQDIQTIRIAGRENRRNAEIELAQMRDKLGKQLIETSKLGII